MLTHFQTVQACKYWFDLPVASKNVEIRLCRALLLWWSQKQLHGAASSMIVSISLQLPDLLPLQYRRTQAGRIYFTFHQVQGGYRGRSLNFWTPPCPFFLHGIHFAPGCSNMPEPLIAIVASGSGEVSSWKGSFPRSWFQIVPCFSLETLRFLRRGGSRDQRLPRRIACPFLATLERPLPSRLYHNIKLIINTLHGDAAISSRGSSSSTLNWAQATH